MARPLYQHYTQVAPDTFVVETKTLFASVGRRLGSFLIDSVIFNAVFVGLLWFYLSRAGLLGGSERRLELWLDRNVFSLVVLYLVSWTLYGAAFESSDLLATPGKRMRGMAVTDTYGFQLRFQRAFLRNIFKFLSIIPLGAGYLLVKRTKRGQALHDLLASTVVLNRDIASR